MYLKKFNFNKKILCSYFIYKAINIVLYTL